jgi:hypothetical protein
MKFNFVVHRVHARKVSATAIVGGVSVPAEVDGLEVELASADGVCTSVRFTLTVPTEIEEAKKKFVLGSKHSWTV